MTDHDHRPPAADVSSGSATDLAGGLPGAGAAGSETAAADDVASKVAGDVDRIRSLVPGDIAEIDPIDSGPDGSGAAAAFDVDRLLGATAVHAVAAADGIGRRRGLAVPVRSIELGHVLATATTHVTVDGVAPPAWADLSGVYPAGGGRHVQIHCNFPHHAAGVAAVLGVDEERGAVAAAIERRDPFELEAALIDAGMVGAVIRRLDEWNDHPHAAATVDLPLVSVEQIGDADPRPLPDPGRSMAGSGRDGDDDDGRRDDAGDGDDDGDGGALAGVRVLDCSRVLAGPVAGQMLAARGADVLRIGAAHLPSVEVGVISTGFAKRAAFVDLRTASGASTMRELLADTDVWIDAYRPGALAGHGFDAVTAARIRPGMVIVQLSAFDAVGPWAGRRGFDSIVQSTTGVRSAGGEFAVDSTGTPLDRGPIGLPVQALDYATGFLAAGVAAQLLAHQRTLGGTWLARLSLLRTRNWLTALRAPGPYEVASVEVPDRHLASIDSAFGRVEAVRPLAGRWHSPPMPLGSSSPEWLPH